MEVSKETEEYNMNVREKYSDLTLKSVSELEGALEEFIYKIKPESEDIVSNMHWFQNKENRSHPDEKSKKKLRVGKLYRYLENSYFQCNPDIQSFADYRFDISNQNSDFDTEQLRSIAQSYLYIFMKYKEKEKLMKDDIGGILRLIQISQRKGNNKILIDTLFREVKTNLINRLCKILGNKIKNKKMRMFGEFDLKNFNDDEKIFILSELYLLKGGKTLD